MLLVFALMVAPAATALRLTRRFATGIALSIGLAVAIAWVSLLLAYLHRLADELLDHRAGDIGLSAQRHGAALESDARSPPSTATNDRS